MAEQVVVWKGLEQAAIGVRGAGGPAYVHLLKSAIVPTEDTVFADLDEADFDGYQAQPLTGWANSHIIPPTTPFPIDKQTAATVVFEALDLPSDYTIYGLFVTDGDGNLLLVDATNDNWPQTIPAGYWDISLDVATFSLNFTESPPPGPPEPPVGYDLWLSREGLATTGVGNVITTWADQSGSSHDFANPGGNDTLVTASLMGQQLFADLVDSFLQAPDTDIGNYGDGGFSLYLLVRKVNSIWMGAPFAKDGYAGTGNGFLFYYSGSLLLYWNGTDGINLITPILEQSYLLEVIRHDQGAGGLVIYNNGTLFNTGTDARTLTNVKTLTLGGDANAANAGALRIEEVLTYPTDHDDAARQLVEAYFASKYSL